MTNATLPADQHWQTLPPLMTAHLATCIIACWLEEIPANAVLISKTVSDLDPAAVHGCWDNALTAAKLIAHTTNLKIPTTTNHGAAQ